MRRRGGSRFPLPPTRFLWVGGPAEPVVRSCQKTKAGRDIRRAGCFFCVAIVAQAFKVGERQGKARVVDVIGRQFHLVGNLFACPPQRRLPSRPPRFAFVECFGRRLGHAYLREKEKRPEERTALCLLAYRIILNIFHIVPFPLSASDLYYAAQDSRSLFRDIQKSTKPPAQYTQGLRTLCK